MLEVAEVYEDVFHLMARIDGPYKKYFSVLKDNSNSDDDVDDKELDFCEEQDKIQKLKTASDRRIGPPTHADFEKARSFVNFLKIFFDVTLAVSGSNYIIVNNLFFHVMGVHSAINAYVAQVKDPVLSSMASRMKQKFVKYWGKMRNQNLLLYIAVVLDPKYKLKLISYCLKQVYEDGNGEEMTQIVKDELVNLFDQYESCSLDKVVEPHSVGVGSSFSSECMKNTLGAFGFLRKGFAEHLERMERKESNSDLMQYLSDCCETDDPTFDVLLWWKLNSTKYPILSKIAKDVLAIPVSTVASEASFNTSRRIIDPYRSRLAPEIIEALICAQNWLITKPAPVCLRTEFDEIDKKEANDVEGGRS